MNLKHLFVFLGWAIICSSPNARGQDLTEGLVALYKFDETEGDVAFDSAIDDGAQDSIMPNGTIAWSPGLIGGALDLDGNSSMQAEDAIPFGTPGFTITAWIFPRSEGSYKGIYASRAATEPIYNWGLNVENAPLRGDLRFANAPRSHGIDTPGTLTLNEWHHLAITYASDGAATTGIGYLNGEQIGTYNGALPVYQTNSTYQIGNDDCCGNRQFNGLIDDLGVFNYTLSAEEVSKIYQDGLEGIGLQPSDNKLPLAIESEGDNLVFTWESLDGKLYNIRSETDPSMAAPLDWPLFDGQQDLEATPPQNTLTLPRPADPFRLFVVEEFDAPPVVVYSTDFEGGAVGWTTLVNDENANTAWELGSPAGSTGPVAGAAESANAWSTNLGDYGPDSDISLRSPAIDLSGVPEAGLSFEAYRDADGFGDAAVVRFLRASDLVQLGAEVPIGMDVFDVDWTTIRVSIVPEAIGETVLIEWNFTSDDTPDSFSGLSIDDVLVSD